MEIAVFNCVNIIFNFIYSYFIFVFFGCHSWENEDMTQFSMSDIVLKFICTLYLPFTQIGITK